MQLGTASILNDPCISRTGTLKALQAENRIVLNRVSFVECLTQAMQKQRRVCLLSASVFW